MSTAFVFSACSLSRGTSSITDALLLETWTSHCARSRHCSYQIARDIIQWSGYLAATAAGLVYSGGSRLVHSTAPPWLTGRVYSTRCGRLTDGDLTNDGSAISQSHNANDVRNAARIAQGTKSDGSFAMKRAPNPAKHRGEARLHRDKHKHNPPCIRQIPHT